MAYCVIEDVRRAIGIDSTVISDADIIAHIKEAEEEVDGYGNTRYESTLTAEKVDGNGQDWIFTKQQPVLRIEELYIDSTEITPAYLHLYDSGKIELGDNAEESSFDNSDSKLIFLKYYYGFLDEDRHTTTLTTTTDEVAGSVVVINVDSTTGFSAGDWIRIFGKDTDEMTKITAVDAGVSITTDLIFDHLTGSTIQKYHIPHKIVRLTAIITGIRVLVEQMGGTYDDVSTYSLGEFNASIGQAYINIDSTVKRLSEEAKKIIGTYIRQMPAFS